MTDADSDLLDALNRRRANRQWNEDAIRNLAASPEGVKRSAAPCANCEAPCEEREICATAVAHREGLVDDWGRDQALHLVESGARRARLRGDVSVRETDDRRPNFFVAAKTE